MLERDPSKRLTAAQALESAWVREGGCACNTPLEGTVVQRLQRHATYGHLKQVLPQHCHLLLPRGSLDSLAADLCVSV